MSYIPLLIAYTLLPKQQKEQGSIPALIHAPKRREMKFVALVSGGKDSVFNLGKCLAYGHELLCLANLYPPHEGPDELDSFMFQSAGATAIEALADCLDVPLIRAPMSGYSGHQGLHYTPTEGDEVEDLYDLLRHVKVNTCRHPLPLHDIHKDNKPYVLYIDTQKGPVP